ncbi:hypothetical protein PoB_002477100 [Plakobranchus ocellatus]|uniref:Uncharacterized protein n=1 Tax=Plakobranchus ocellatus TaxID=259542 RepID=A0AAV3ZQM1_9GAST|nr:hypothetical protein PoB_002477100 [Plakobranchus ocellatus]
MPAGGVGDTVTSESALRSAGTLLHRVRAPPRVLLPDGRSKSLRSPFLWTGYIQKPTIPINSPTFAQYKKANPENRTDFVKSCVCDMSKVIFLPHLLLFLKQSINHWECLRQKLGTSISTEHSLDKAKIDPPISLLVLYLTRSLARSLQMSLSLSLSFLDS